MNAFMAIMEHAKFHFNRLILTLIFGIQASEPDERLKRPGLTGLSIFPYPDYYCFLLCFSDKTLQIFISFFLLAFLGKNRFLPSNLCHILGSYIGYHLRLIG